MHLLKCTLLYDEHIEPLFETRFHLLKATGGHRKDMETDDNDGREDSD
jgi:hypothetical protein